MKRKNWTREELIVTFNLYCKIPFGRIHNRNPEIISLAKLIDRSPSALSWKLANFSRFDPALKARGIKGASHGSNAEEDIWHEFHNDWSSLSFQSEMLVAKLNGIDEEQLEEDTTEEFPIGQEKSVVTRVRLHQRFFRRMILASYNSKCCITGLAIPELLVASHIVPWAVDTKNRVNPRNGLCLNAFHDRAFDKGMLTLTSTFKVKVSSRIKEVQDDEVTKDYLLRYHDSEIIIPEKFVPDISFIKYHNQKVFR